MFLPKYFDAHLHLRQGEMLRNVLPFTAKHAQYAIVMPNTDPPILHGLNALLYECRIQAELNKSGIEHFRPLMTIQITPQTTPRIIYDAREHGVIAGKAYPYGVTTNSLNGIVDYQALAPVFEAMEDSKMVLCLHGEQPGQDVYCLDRVYLFLDTLVWIAETFPELRIVLEHVNIAKALETVLTLGDNVAASITAHHLFLTLNDVLGPKLHPHHFCKPEAQRPGDRSALIAAAIGTSKKVFLGTDSAPHLRGAKECSDGCAGVFTAPVAPSLLAELFEGEGALERLPDFLFYNAQQFYRVPLADPMPQMRMAKEAWIVPGELHGIVPFMAGKELQWRIVE